LTYGIDAELVKEATGKYYVDLFLDEAGRWKMALREQRDRGQRATG
jgi:hypothetical protein